MRHMLERTRNPIAIAVALLAPTVVFGAGFALQENSGSGLGNAYAGGAAVAEDASTLWSNAAGMARLGSGQVAGALNLIQPSLKFRNANSIAAATPRSRTSWNGSGTSAGPSSEKPPQT